jgi:hypothetical protein
VTSVAAVGRAELKRAPVLSAGTVTAQLVARARPARCDVERSSECPHPAFPAYPAPGNLRSTEEAMTGSPGTGKVMGWGIRLEV